MNDKMAVENIIGLPYFYLLFHNFNRVRDRFCIRELDNLTTKIKFKAKI